MLHYRKKEKSFKDVVQREKNAHNEIFGKNKRAELGKFYSIAKESGRKHDELILNEIREKENSIILDYGCGKGEHSLRLKKMGIPNVIGIDISDTGIKIANEQIEKTKMEGIEFYVMNAMNMEFRDDTFDVVSGYGILHHLDIESSLFEIKRVLKSGGIGIFNEPLGSNPLINLFRRMTPGYRTIDEHPLKKRDFAIIRELFPECEFRYYYLFSILAIPFRNQKYFEALLDKMMLLDNFLFSHFAMTRQLAWQCLVIMRKN